MRFLGRQKLDRVPVTWPKQPELTPIERRELGLVKAFDDRENGGVDEADVGVGIPVA